MTHSLGNCGQLLHKLCTARMCVFVCVFNSRGHASVIYICSYSFHLFRFYLYGEFRISTENKEASNHTFPCVVFRAFCIFMCFPRRVCPPLFPLGVRLYCWEGSLGAILNHLDHLVASGVQDANMISKGIKTLPCDIEDWHFKDKEIGRPHLENKNNANNQMC